MLKLEIVEFKNKSLNSTIKNLLEIFVVIKLIIKKLCKKKVIFPLIKHIFSNCEGSNIGDLLFYQFYVIRNTAILISNNFFRQ